MAVTDILKRDPVATARKTHEAAQRGLANAQAKRAAAVAEVEAAERAQTVAATADGDAADGVLESATRRLRDARDLVDAFDRRVIPSAGAAVTEAEAGVADAERQVQYAAAEAKGAAARAKLAKDYPGLEQRYTELLNLVAEADAAIDVATPISLRTQTHCPRSRSRYATTLRSRNASCPTLSRPSGIIRTAAGFWISLASRMANTSTTSRASWSTMSSRTTAERSTPALSCQSRAA